ncbi:putative secreted protein [Streptomyces ambofaciens ATCC 23877]|uniref:Secreted protein n=2 Tax=Streptomyces ambofaciens TaxID=1889 RepID=A0ABN4PFR6_STRAM|nr:hypothetical protein [Streptomyces ambofaciens]AKZ60203.1 putative secreted protein [Streptomyces ambofaciens ATCC 23877]ANB10412.1 hypothetical protein SAM40697_6459 [Streptomyces ambofaciens]CAJ88143.1 putative secreted protein [Streptomyces ambofaciens ATCC 23877]
MRFSLGARVATTATALGTALGAFASMGTATAAVAVPNGEWAPFTRCPVDAPAMLAADGLARTPQCVVSTSPNGSIKLGKTTVTTGRTNLQIGVIQNSDGTSSVVAPAGGALIADSATVPGGLLGLMCPSNIPAVTAICEQLSNSSLNKITATVESVGAPYDFNQTAGILTDEPIVALPVRIHLENPFLGSKCYIGSAAKPIVLRPENRQFPEFGMSFFRGDGTVADDGEMSRINLTGATQNDSSFAVPGASGCGLGLFGLIDAAVNAKTGLPSAAGNNSLTLNNAQTHLAGLNAPGTVAPDAGKHLSRNWHSAVE